MSLSQDAAAVVSAMDRATHTCQDTDIDTDTEAGTTALDGSTNFERLPEQDELLLNIQFPDCAPKDFLNGHSDSATDTTVSVNVF